jgi:hypothetical protein
MRKMFPEMFPDAFSADLPRRPGHVLGAAAPLRRPPPLPLTPPPPWFSRTPGGGGVLDRTAGRQCVARRQLISPQIMTKRSLNNAKCSLISVKCSLNSAKCSLNGAKPTPSAPSRDLFRPFRETEFLIATGF